jgi:hypothetical protein
MEATSTANAHASNELLQRRGSGFGAMTTTYGSLRRLKPD